MFLMSLVAFFDFITDIIYLASFNKAISLFKICNTDGYKVLYSFFPFYNV